MKNFICSLLLVPLFLKTLPAQTIVYANAQTNAISGICALCSISSPNNAVDGNTATAASITTVIGAGATLRMNLTFPSAGNSSDIICVGLGSPSGINISALSSVTFIVKNGGSTVGTYASSSLFAINLLAGSVYAVYVYPNAAFDEIDVKLNYTAGALNQMDVYFASFSNYVLGIDLNSFAAEHNNGSVILSWNAEDEKEGNSFMIQRSDDGQNFENIKQISGAQNSAASNHYTWTDNFPYRGNNYYRLQELTLNGLEDESGIVHTYVPSSVKGNDITVYSEPSGAIDIQGAIADGDNNLYIFTAGGQLVSKIAAIAEQGRIHLSPTGLIQGIYFMKIVSSHSSSTCEFKL